MLARVRTATNDDHRGGTGISGFDTGIETIQANRNQPEQQAWYMDDYHWTIGQKAHPMTKYTVKLGTRLLSMGGQLERADAYYRWLYALCGATEAPGSPLIHQHLWKLPMDNQWKEPFWHVSMGGFICSSGSKPCACGMCETPDILHHFKHCPVAAAVYGQISDESIHAEKVQFLVWTGTPPQRMPKTIWLFICVSAVYAIDRGRRYMYKLKYHAAGPVPQADTISPKERPSPFRPSGISSISTPRKCLKASQNMPPIQL